MGEVFAGRYELVDPIGRGGAGAVWRAWDHRRRRYVAAKVLRQSDAYALLRFVREQAVRIDHPHVLAPASWAADDDKVLFTMDLVRGGSLAHVIGDYGPLPPRLVCVLLDQLLAGLAAVHAEGLVHRDVKPANLLLEATGTGRPHLRLTDFGIAMRKGEPRLTETDHVVGTPGFFAPEQLDGAEPDFPADLYAAGLVGLYLLLGRQPDGQALAGHFAAQDTATAPAGVPEPLWQALRHLLHTDPQARFRTATAARKALASAVELLPGPPSGEEDEPVEIFDQIGPLPPGFGPNGPEDRRYGPEERYGPEGRQYGPKERYGPEGRQYGPEGRRYGSEERPYGPTPPEVPPAGTPTPPPTPYPPRPAGRHRRVSEPGRPEGIPVHYAPASALTGGGTASTSAPAPAPHPPPPGPAAPPAPGAPSPHRGTGPTLPYTTPRPTPPTAPPRPGPSPRTALAVVLLALLCFAIGFWALAQG
ncbi:serine/threonine-protein kinase [Streptomyces lichenis]|uniref:non-specific serine/threonine protein kinase n=1 Tax=Streptomyces lichenis TaxID=2306967 RepID=A0ABT0I4N0_9ACTN|nr:serine/threonine-protein kinase [Streptomyces lichenis]MCK8676277.1 serine/threonine protein kinase [Streptomyces lichenis]